MVSFLGRVRITYGSLSSTSPELYDRYLDIAYSDDRSVITAGFNHNKAIALMMHPMRPDIQPLLEYYRSIASHPRSREFPSKHFDEAWFRWHLCKEAPQMLRRQSRETDVLWVNQLAKSSTVSVCNCKPVEQSPQPRHLDRTIL